ncbi:MAG: hypothetical protein JW863_03175 [Chitinispirillaceae bacterium]|nr:hypothetical protein [Chitinispirillaceae bacterium]
MFTSDARRQLWVKVLWNILSIVLLSGILTCGKKAGEPVTASLFEQWFVSAGGEPPAALKRARRTAVDSLRDAVRRSRSAGNGSVILTDTFGVSYTTGFGTPMHYRNDSVYPLIIYLHGGTGAARNDKGEHAWEMLGMLSDSMDLFFASPSAGRSAPWWSPAGLSRILQTLRYMSLRYPVNPAKIFLAGVSDGATGCWAAANTIAAPFAGFISISGYGGMLPQLGMELHPGNLMQRPIYNVNAGRDRLYPLASVNSFLDYLEQRGVGIRRREYPDEEHGFDYRDRERGMLCSLVRTWSLPAAGPVNWYAPGTYPFSITGVAAVERSATDSFSLRVYHRNDTIFLETGGLTGLQMYFEDDRSHEADRVFSINGICSRRLKKKTPEMGALIEYMKQRCCPIITDGVVYTISL